MNNPQIYKYHIQIPTQTRGFHLIELLITLFIISMLTAVSLPVYTQYMIKIHRVEAVAALSKLAIVMEDFYLQNNSYTGANFSNLHFPKTLKNNYHLTIKTTAGDYLLSAKPIGKQAQLDTLCATLLLAANGEKKITGQGNVNACW